MESAVAMTTPASSSASSKASSDSPTTATPVPSSVTA